MGLIRLDGHPEVEIVLRRSAQARRMSLRVSALDGRVTLTVPRGLPEADARAFAREKSGWIRSAKERTPDPDGIGAGKLLPVEGVARSVRLAPVKAAELSGDVLVLPERAPGPAAKAYLTLLARERLGVSVTRHAGSLGVSAGAIALRDTRSRWGSCTAAGRLMFSFRLVMAPPEVLNYVAVHEVAHLREMNHSAAFWALVERLDPRWRASRAWLKREGPALHRIRFED